MEGFDAVKDAAKIARLTKELQRQQRIVILAEGLAASFAASDLADNLNDGNYGAAAGNVGEILLRLLSIKFSASELRALRGVKPWKARPFSQLIKDIEANPDKWEVAKSVREVSSNIRNRGGSSLQELLENKETGETIVRHTLFRDNGGIFEPAHYRPFWE